MRAANRAKTWRVTLRIIDPYGKQRILSRDYAIKSKASARTAACHLRGVMEVISIEAIHRDGKDSHDRYL
jgi:C4-type Zn-finger protein